MHYVWISAVAALIFVSVMTHKGRVFSGSVGEGITMWAILSVAVVSGFIAGMDYAETKHQDYIIDHCFVHGGYMICRGVDYIDSEPPVTGSKWNEH